MAVYISGSMHTHLGTWLQVRGKELQTASMHVWGTDGGS